MRSFGIGKKLFCCVMAMFALMVTLSVVVHVSLTGMEEAHHRTVDKSARKLILINQIDTAKSDLLAAQRGLFQRMWFKEYDLAEAARQSFHKNVQLSQRYLEEMRPLASTAEEAKLVEKLYAQTQAWPGKFAETNRLLVAGKAEEAKDYTHKVPMFVGTEQTVSEFKKLEIALLEQEKQRASRQAAISRYLAWGMSSISLVMGVLFFFMIHRMTGKLNGFTQQLSRELQPDCEFSGTGLGVFAGSCPRRFRAGGIARRDLVIHGGDHLHDQAEHGECQRRRAAGGRFGPAV